MYLNTKKARRVDQYYSQEEMTFASQYSTLFSTLYLILLLLFLIHETQSCPKSIHFDCPDHAYSTGESTLLDFPFTNIYKPECGHCVLKCSELNQTKINCMGNPEANYLTALDINPSKLTIVAAYPSDGMHPEKEDPCVVSNAGFLSTQSVSFTNGTSPQMMEEFVTFIRCPYLDHDGSQNYNNISYKVCKNGDRIYGPFEYGKSPESLPLLHGCFNIQVPSLSSDFNNANVSIHYDISAECQRCLAHGGRCHDLSNGKVLCDRTNKGKHLGAILGTVLPGSALILAFIVYCLRRSQRKNKSGSSTLPSRSTSFNHIRLDLEDGSMHGVTVFSYTELEEATNNFDPSKQLGEGGFGVVYHGKLRDGREVAVKRLYEKSFKRIEQFKNEIKILTDLRHQNLVTLYGCTSRHTRELLLVYEYIPNGTVADHLHGELAESKLLRWSTRISIAIETATALSFLHFNDIIHRDVKTNNILLDNSFTVKVADFGLSRLFPPDVTHVSTAPQGTPGYVDPEYYQCYHLTDKSDVYSFGVLLIELISSLPAVDIGRQKHEINLSNYAMNRIMSSAHSELVDPKLGFETDFKVRRMITLVAELASQCLQHERELRPSMEEVTENLKRIASEDYDAIEAEETEWSARTTHVTKPPPSPTDNDDVDLLRNNHLQPPSPVSVMDKWLNSSKSTTPNTSRSS